MSIPGIGLFWVQVDEEVIVRPRSVLSFSLFVYLSRMSIRGISFFGFKEMKKLLEELMEEE